MDISTLTPDKQVKLQYWLDVIRQCRAYFFKKLLLLDCKDPEAGA